MNNFLYAMTESFEKIQVEIYRILNMSAYTEKEKNELFLVVSSCLHYILDYADRVDIEKEHKKLLSAYRYANNSLKHCIEVKEITDQKGGIVFPIHFPIEISERIIVWSIIDNGGEKVENQRNNYKKFLEGKDIVETCKYAIDILEKYKF